jgi:MoaA/NifB/PqqE/SkfB family radical SAM enzyme
MQLIDIDAHIHTNTHCNFQCIHCYENAENSIKMSLTDEFEINLIKFFCKTYNADIHLEGGEIFLEEHFIAALLNLDESVARHLTITTNGSLRSQNRETIRALRSIGCLRISVEGHTDTLHQALRGRELQPILDNALYYQDQGIPIALRLTLNTLNIGAMFSETIPALEAKGFRRFQMYEMQPVGRGMTAGMCITGRLDSFFTNWLNSQPKSSIKVSLPLRRRAEVYDYSAQLERVGISVEDVGNVASVSIGADGSVRVCPWDTTSEPLLFICEDNIETLRTVIESQNIPHECAFCSRIVLKGGSPC